MNKLAFKSILFFSIVVFCNSVNAQAANDTLINGNMKLELKNDTLFSDAGLKFFIGQKFIVGNAAGEDEYYRSIIDKSAAIVPSIWGQDKRFENAIENHVNKKKSREKVKKALVPGKSVTIKRIAYSKTGKPYFYIVDLSSDAGDYYCDLRLALILKELLLQP